MDALLITYEKVYNELKKLNEHLEGLNQKANKNKTDYLRNVSDAKRKLAEELDENNRNIDKVRAFVEIARTHSSSHAKAVVAKSYNSRALSQLSVQINSGMSNDPFAVKLYSEATAQLQYLENIVAPLKRKTQEQIQSMTQKYEQTKNDIKNEIDTLKAEIIAYLKSKAFSTFLDLVLEDHAAFGGSMDRMVLSPEQHGTISIGSAEFPFPVPQDMGNEFTDFSKGVCNAETSTVRLPLKVSINNGNVFVAEYTSTTESQILSGIQNFILNIARYYGQSFTRVVFIDPVRYNASGLGCLAQISGAGNAFIDAVPASMDEIRKKLKNIISNINICEKRASFGQDMEKAVYVFHDFPQAYDTSLLSQIQQLCVNAERYGIVVILTHNTSSKNYSCSDVYEFVQTKAMNIRNCDGTLFFKDQTTSLARFVWYQAPTQLPKDIERIYIHEKPVIDLSNDYSKRIGVVLSKEYQKGYRKIEKIPYGVDSQGVLQYLDFENTNFATFISGSSRSGKSTLLHTLITGIIKNNHPDDIEIWLIDFKMTEFSRYVEHMPPHVRYIILDDSPDLVYDIIDRLTEILIKRQNMFKGKWQKLSDVPTEKYMPAMMIIIDEFSIMSQIIADSVNNSNENYIEKLQMLLAKGAALGFHFIFANQGFTSGSRGLSDFSKKQIQQRISMKTAEYNEIKETLDLKSTTEEDRTLMEQLVEHYTLTRIPPDEYGNHLKHSHVLFISDYTEQEEFIDSLSKSISTVPRYDPLNTSVYIYKKPMIIDGNIYLAFKSKKAEMCSYISKRKESPEFEDEQVLFIGEPRRMLPLFPIPILNEFGENILFIAPAKETMAASSVVLSMLYSLRMQGNQAVFWSAKKNAIYKQIKNGCNEPIQAKCDLDTICSEIETIKEKIQANIESNEFYVLLGFESILTEMTHQTQGEKDRLSLIGNVTYEKREVGELDLLTQLALASSETEESDPLLPTERETTKRMKAPNTMQQKT